MGNIWLWSAVFLSAAATGTVVERAWADEDHVVARQLLESGKILSLEDIVVRARTHKTGEILETELEFKHDHYVYEVEILDAGGQVWELKLDAGTGDLIKMERDD
jgi:uncharacterized membrane protein YkoI